VQQEESRGGRKKQDEEDEKNAEEILEFTINEEKGEDISDENTMMIMSMHWQRRLFLLIASSDRKTYR
jgi:hypothetical protein